jgi:hypothetical protein
MTTVHASDYDYFLVIHGREGEVHHRGPVNDFLPCYEDLLFTSVVDGAIPNDGTQPAVWVEPVGDPPKIAGVKVSVGSSSKTYSLNIFGNRVWEVLLAKDLLKECLEQEGSTIWHVEAKKRRGLPQARRLAVAVRRRPYPIEDRPLADFGITNAEEGDPALDVFVRRDVLDRLCRDAATSLDCERASFLTGHLVCEKPGRAAVVIQDQIPAAVETSASKTHVAFSPLTFQAAREELEARRNGAEMVAWAHNHPPTCGRDCLMKVPACGTDSVFFSLQDRVLHRASFAAPYMVALVGGKGADRRADDPIVRAYGWRDGVIQERSFQVY